MLRIENIHMNYGKSNVLKGVNLTANSDEILFLLGDNGQGKTTLLNIISGICNESKGKIKINGLERIKDEKAYKKLLGYSADAIKMLEYHTVDQYIKFVLSIYDCKIETKELEEKINLLKLDSERNKQIKSLSKGNKKKVSILTSFLHNPKVLMLDEPLDGLDPDVQSDAINLIKELKKGRAILIVTHSMDVVEELGDRVAILFNGRIVENSSIDELYEKYSTKDMRKIYRRVKENAEKYSSSI